MIYSVWQPNGRYKYYETGDIPVATGPTPKHLRPGSLGVAPERSGWPLPSNAREAGEGELPRGQVSSGRKALSGTSESPLNWIEIVGLGLFTFGLYKVLQ